MPSREGVTLSKPTFFQKIVEDPTIFGTEHRWQWSTKSMGISCLHCNTWISKGFAWGHIRELIEGVCERKEEPPKKVKLHSTHQMEAMGEGWKCVVCKQSMQKKEGKWQLPVALMRRCQGELEETQTSLGQFFSQSSHSSGSQISRPVLEEELAEPGMEVDFF